MIIRNTDFKIYEKFCIEKKEYIVYLLADLEKGSLLSKPEGAAAADEKLLTDANLGDPRPVKDDDDDDDSWLFLGGD